MPSHPIPKHFNTLIVGNGPSALILSYILHGNIPYYDPSIPHPDPILHGILSESPCLLNVNLKDLTAHFSASRLSYSTQALPINVLLDTLVRPLADTDPGEHQSCVRWVKEPGRKIQHSVLGNSTQAGGQWADNPVAASWDIGALSYAEMLSLPGYTFEDHYHMAHHGKPLPDFHRPTRREVADYLAKYPEMVGISDSVYTGVEVNSIQRTKSGFYLGSHGITCKTLVLATGTFSNLIPPRPLLLPLKDLPPKNEEGPLLVIGSGFTAADVIISAPPNRKIIHIFKWDPDNHPSPLRACHPSAYPEYASVYKRMKLAAQQNLGASVVSPLRFKKSNPFFDTRDRENVYEGFPNTYIKDVSIGDDTATPVLETGSGEETRREVSNMEYVIGRRGSLDYLDPHLRLEVLGTGGSKIMVSGRALRPKVEETVEVAPHVMAIGSLTGDSLIRFAYGGCAAAAQVILESEVPPRNGKDSQTSSSTASPASAMSSDTSLDDQEHHRHYIASNGHADLDVNRKNGDCSFDHKVV